MSRPNRSRAMSRANRSRAMSRANRSRAMSRDCRRLIDGAFAGRELAQHMADVAERALKPNHRVTRFEQLLPRIGIHDERCCDRVGACTGLVERTHEIAQLRAAFLDHFG